MKWSSGGNGVWLLSECKRACRLLAAPDLDQSGTAEALLVVDAGASAQFFEALELYPSVAGPVELGVGPPGADGFPHDQPATFEWGGSVTHQGNMTCGPLEGPSPQPSGTSKVVASSAVLSHDGSTWTINETSLSFSYDYNRDVSKLVKGRRIADAFVPLGSDTLTLNVGDPRVQQFLAGNEICGARVSG